jgi:hypothetical protein
MLYSRVYGTRHHQATYCINAYKKLGDKKGQTTARLKYNTQRQQTGWM